MQTRGRLPTPVLLATSPLARHAHSLARMLTCFTFFPQIFEEKRDCSQPTYSASNNGCHIYLGPASSGFAVALLRESYAFV